MTFIMWWAILPVLGLVFAGVAILRARVLHTRIQFSQAHDRLSG